MLNDRAPKFVTSCTVNQADDHDQRQGVPKTIDFSEKYQVQLQRTMSIIKSRMASSEYHVCFGLPGGSPRFGYGGINIGPEYASKIASKFSNPAIIV